MDSEKLKEILKRREDSKRRANIMKILELIESGEFDSERIPLNSLYSIHEGPRQEYVSPEDRDTYNSGYMEVSEMMSSSLNVR